MIEATGLTKRYGSKTAVDDVSFTVAPGKVTGFLGPNGAGKSTTMRMIVGLDRPTRGRVTVNGRGYRDHAAPLAEVGCLLDAKALHTGRTAANHLRAMAATHGISRSRVDEVIGMTGLVDVADKRVGGFSLGMGQRLGIAAALLGDPQTLILDEPVNGLDPEGVIWVRTLVRTLAADGRTVFLSSHLMSEMALTADHIIVIGRGRILADAPVAEVVAGAAGTAVQVRTPQPEAFEALMAQFGADRDDHGGRPVRGARHLRPGDRGGRRGRRHHAARAVPAAGLPGGRVPAAHRRRGRVPLDRRRPFPRPHRRSRAHHRRQPPMTALTTALLEPDNRLFSLSRPTTLPVTFVRVVAGEWIKLRTVRSTVWTLVAMVALMVGFATLAAWGSTLTLEDQPAVVGMNVAQLLSAGYQLGQLAVAVLAVLTITGEYSTGMIRSSFAAVPRRLPVLAAKAVVLGAVVTVLAVLTMALSYVATMPFHDDLEATFDLSSAETLRMTVGLPLYLVAVALLAFAVGALLRHTAGAITAVLATLLVIDNVVLLVPLRVFELIGPFLPSAAGRRILFDDEMLTSLDAVAEGATLSPWQGFGVLLGWVAVLLTAAAVRLRRRDA